MVTVRINTTIAFSILIAVLCCGTVVQGQNRGVPASDAIAVSYLQRSFVALAGGTQIRSIVLSTTATETVGTDSDTGTATFKFTGTGQSRAEYSTRDGSRIETRNNSSGFPVCARTGPDGITHRLAQHNCWIDGWIVPDLALSIAASNPRYITRYLGQHVLAGTNVQHLRTFLASSTPIVQHLSTVDWYIDSATALPTAATFNLHPDDNTGVDIPVHVIFSNYQKFGGVLLPSRIQQYIQGTLALDLQVTGAVLNANLPDSEFTIQ